MLCPWGGCSHALIEWGTVQQALSKIVQMTVPLSKGRSRYALQVTCINACKKCIMGCLNNGKAVL